MAETPSPNRILKIRVSEAAAANLDFEAQLENSNVGDFVRNGIATHIQVRSTLREIKAHFGGDGDGLEFYLTVTAVQGTRAQDFAVAPNPETMQVSVIPGEEYEI